MEHDQAQRGARGNHRGLTGLLRLIGQTPASLYLPIAFASMWQYAMVKIWNHFCTTPAANLYLCEGAVLLAAAVLLATALASRPLRLLGSTPAGYALAIFFGLSSLGIVILGPFPGIDVAMGLLGSLSIVWLYPRCGHLYTGLGFTRTIVCIVISLVLAYAIKIATYLLPDPAVYPLVCSMPLLFELAYGKALKARTDLRGNRPQPAMRALPRSSKGFLVALALEVVAFDVVAGFFGTPLLRGYGWVHQLILMGIVLAVLVVLLKHGPEVRLGQLFEIALLCCLLVFVVLSFTNSTSPIALAIINVPSNIVTALLWLLLVDLENRREYPRLVVLAAGWGISNLAIGIGQSLSAYVVEAGDLPPNFMIVLAFFLVASVVFVFSKFATYDTFSSYAKAEDRAKTGIDYSQIEATCAALGEQRRLTKREIEVVQLIAKGRSRGYIASSLVISENTVKGHTRNAYGKLGIHSKQELLTLIETQ